MKNIKVRHSRAGDVFHYRWAARRCLRMINQRNGIESIHVEASDEPFSAGEYVIDLAEYYTGQNDCRSVVYFQLKHTTVRKNSPFTFSEIKKTLAGFATLYREHLAQNKRRRSIQLISFCFVSNRGVNERIKSSFRSLGAGAQIDRKLLDEIKTTTALTGSALRTFCRSLQFQDQETNYIGQRHRLRGEIAEYTAGYSENQQIDHLIALVEERVLPNSNGVITREDVLMRFDVTSDRDFYPAPSEFVSVTNLIARSQHDDLVRSIRTSDGPVIVHAPGGVGKSVVAQQIAASLPQGSKAVVYDCFGGGKYRSPSEPRHRASYALVQIANELASDGLCACLIAQSGVPDHVLFREFVSRVKRATAALHRGKSKARLYLLIDAADNSAMASSELGESCFVHGLLRENLPSSCQIVLFSRTERINLLQPTSKIRQYALQPFSIAETGEFVRRTFKDASDADCREFHRLTNGNPRVQANALHAVGGKSFQTILTDLGPNRTTVEDQISAQLGRAICAVKEKLPPAFEAHIQRICQGMANLPPFVPIEVLSKAAEVEPETVHSLVSDLGSSLWLTDDSLQFRDEPTETWFRQHFSATVHDVAKYITALEPLAQSFTYVAKALPQLLLKAGKHEELILLALSDKLLPANNPVDERHVRLYRLQFAFKAALKVGRLVDAAKLALRAGEEVASNERQNKIFEDNPDLIAPLQDEHRVQELAYAQKIKSGWPGSENLYSASLLSCVKHFHGEARSYLRNARRWLNVYFQERDKYKEKPEHWAYREALKDDDLAEFAWTHLNLHGPKAALEFIMHWKPPQVVFRIAQTFFHRLIDASRFDEINRIAALGADNPHVMLAASHQLLRVGEFPPKSQLLKCLRVLIGRKKLKIDSDRSQDLYRPAIISFAEACAFRKLPKRKLLHLLNLYTPAFADRSICSEAESADRSSFLRRTALSLVLTGQVQSDTSKLLRKNRRGKQQRFNLSTSDKAEITRVIDQLLPWYYHRAGVLAGRSDANALSIEETRQRAGRREESYPHYERPYQLPFEHYRAWFDLLLVKRNVTSSELQRFIDLAIAPAEAKFLFWDRLHATRAAFRADHLSSLRDELEKSCQGAITAPGTEGPDERSEWFIALARAVLPVRRTDATAYFESAIEVVSKFGDEVVRRWEAVVALANRASNGGIVSSEVAYRFVRCAEMVGESVTREKYWDRAGALRTATNLNAPTALAALSRWRDRDIGWFENEILAVADQAVQNGSLSAEVAFALTGFKGCNADAEFVTSCIKKATSDESRTYMLDTAIQDFELANTSPEKWQLLLATAADLKKATKLLKMRSVSAFPSKKIRQTQRIDDDYKKALKAIRKLVRNVNPVSATEVAVALETFRSSSEPPRRFEWFWWEIIRKVPEGREIEFLRGIILDSHLDWHDLQTALGNIPRRWLERIGVKRALPSLMEAVGRIHSIDFLLYQNYEFYRGIDPLVRGWSETIRRGVIKGIADAPELMDATALFNFVTCICPEINESDANLLLDYALSRFENHIDVGFADGPWDSWLEPPSSSILAVAKMIWAALGSPEASIRWQAAHCVRRLVQRSCDAEIEALVELLNNPQIGAFGCKNFPFYTLHAKLYLLTALSRAALQISAPLIRYSNVFQEIALSGMPHVLIQSTAARIALALEKAKPGTYTTEVVAALHSVGKSTFQRQLVEGAQELKSTTPYHSRGELTLRAEVHFDYDFDRYWLEPLGNVFGVKKEAVEDLARWMAAKYFGVSDSRIEKDPRQEQWNALDRRRGTRTWSDHGTYPNIDRLHFYQAYHSLFGAASLLVKEMPVLHSTDWGGESDRWESWLQRHSLTRTDRRWAADRRDRKPICRARWGDSRDEKWLSSVSVDDFLYHIRPEAKRGWLCLDANWTEFDDNVFEKVRIHSRLVNRFTTHALINALQTVDDANRLNLWQSMDDGANCGATYFDAREWLTSSETEFSDPSLADPHANRLGYRPPSIVPELISTMKLSADDELREWRVPHRKAPVITCDMWSDEQKYDHPYYPGHRVLGQSSFLRRLCEKTDKNLVIEILIQRTPNKTYRQHDPDAPTYFPPYHKLFYISSDGILKDTNHNYRPR
jgi:hypothetical protein